MKKLLMISFYELKDYLQTIATSFSNNYKWDVIYYPLYMYCYDKNSKIDGYIEHFDNTIKKEKPDIILWWFTDVPFNVFTIIKNHHPNIYYILYNADDPVNINKTFLDKCKIFNLIITPCQQNIHMYTTYCNIKNVTFFPVGADPEIFRSYTEKEIKLLSSDESNKDTDKDTYKATNIFTISFICDTLYTNYDKQVVPRKTLIETITKLSRKNGWVFNLYGPAYLKQLYPEIYQSDPDYLIRPIIFNKSNVNILTNPIKNIKILINQNTMQIMSCGGIILMDNTHGVKDFFNKNTQTVFLYEDIRTLESQLYNIEKLYKVNIDMINGIKQSCMNFSQLYTWDKFTEMIYCNYCKNNFDYKSYIERYMIKDKIEPHDAYEYWLDRYMNKIREICYHITVPTTFNSKCYKEKYEIESDNVEYIYIDWWHRGKNSDYIGKTSSNNSISIEQLNIISKDIFSLYDAFNTVSTDDKLNGIIKIHMIAKKNPRIHINEALKQYIDIIEST